MREIPTSSRSKPTRTASSRSSSSLPLSSLASAARPPFLLLPILPGLAGQLDPASGFAGAFPPERFWTQTFSYAVATNPEIRWLWFLFFPFIPSVFVATASIALFILFIFYSVLSSSSFLPRLSFLVLTVPHCSAISPSLPRPTEEVIAVRRGREKPLYYCLEDEFGLDNPLEIMPLSNRRRTRRKEIKLQETSDAEAPDSSPSRPANKKRKVSCATTPSPLGGT